MDLKAHKHVNQNVQTMNIDKRTLRIQTTAILLDIDT